MIASVHGPRCIAAENVAAEIARHVPRLAQQRGLDQALLFAALAVMPVAWKPAAEYENRREEAERRIMHRDPDDWPTVALALELGLPVWSQDKDFTEAGVDVLTTGVSIRLRPPTIPPYTFRVAAAIALCVPGSTHPTRIIREHWPGAHNRKRLVTFGQLITDDPHGTAILAALCALADSLDRDGAAIDYERRRKLASATELLDSHAWRVMCRAGGTLAGAQPKLAHARLWLWETLTGGLPRQAPSALGLGCPEFLSRHSGFAFGLRAATVRRLEEHARRLLDAHGCHDEPLTWSPRSDAEELRELVTHGNSLRAIAARYDIRRGTIHDELRRPRHPDPAKRPTPPCDRA